MTRCFLRNVSPESSRLGKLKKREDTATGRKALPSVEKTQPENEGALRYVGSKRTEARS